ncbi:alpha/beta hydrolase [Paraburkholderia rhynchosiae]|uniref:Alpha/beta hydrolase n=1 Tax=Paraburkholderia rhynchosiae TaxID=487049 RepID=A0ABX4V4F5_9BURK|nr:alpha/beta hydrolase [Paraburkholderia rhynchosiae]
MVRRERGRWLDAFGFGPIETPSRVVRSWPGAELRAYGETGQVSQPSSAAALLIVPAPIKQAYIWDLAPEVSVVRRALEAGLRVYLIRWKELKRDAAEQDDGLAAYADSLIAQSLEAIGADGGRRATVPVVLVGHSLGGTLAAIFTALHPETVRALVILEAPVCFAGSAAGAFAPLAQWAPPADAIVAALGGQVPGSFLNLVCTSAAPDEFQWERWQDVALSSSDPLALWLHLRVERWTHDEFALPGRLFAEVVEYLYREDRFSRGTLNIDGRLAAPAHISVPVLAVFNPRSRIVPAVSIVPFIGALAMHTDAQALRYEGDTGVALQHVGVLVGRNAHLRLWPVILDWIRQHCQRTAER